MSHLFELKLTEVVQALSNKEISSRELTQAYLDRIDKLEPELNVFITLDPDNALAQANFADIKRQEDPEETFLLGVPIAIKDVLAVKGLRATAGSKILESFIPPYDATVVERLRKAGMVIIGKTNTDEFAMGSSTENSAYGVTHNPWDTSRVPGGSSGGSAAAVAAQMTPIALGTDTGGSVRQPASFCGVTGLKPTYGRVSRYGLIAYGSSLDSVGVLGQDVEDVALIYNLINGRDTRDATSSQNPKDEINLNGNRTLQNVRVGVPDEYFRKGLQSEVETAVRDAIQTLETLGAEIHIIQLPHTQYAVPVYYLIAPAEASANLARFDGLRYGPRVDGGNLRDTYTQTRGQLFGRETKRRIMLGTYALSAGYQDAYYGKAQKVRTLIQGDFEKAFEKVDLIAAPVAPTTAFEIGAHQGDPLSMYLEDIYTLPANLAGVPGIAFPVGFDSRRLPIGMQLIGAHFKEQILMSVAHSYQSATDWHTKKPIL
ncbi:MAG: Asp-tRNA(Asn)/Glu-tRNA(Gln) amidotransferase subunit GatA [Anaerolineales bacterium]|nr:Asp-tRNA(Asn)/Glu-tRNA(Gln) amidotransferase subunit GatA [Chloroflexota bacterium]MBL6981098.1 Asp-tRNA(Asn)/Glu-tRNA(Gln) amidotransferase subunit GatA [Anaerolineales bacterium]